MMISTHRVIFQPQMNDALVKERGIEAYQVNQRVSSLFSVTINLDLVSFGRESTIHSRDDSYVGSSANAGMNQRRSRFSSVPTFLDATAKESTGQQSLSASELPEGNPEASSGGQSDASLSGNGLCGDSSLETTFGPYAKPRASDLPKYVTLEFHSRKGFNKYWFAVKDE